MATTYAPAAGTFDYSHGAVDDADLYPTETAGTLATVTGRRITSGQRAAVDYRAYLEARITAADDATNGTLVSKAGEARGLKGRRWFTGRTVSTRYASEELRTWFDDNGPNLTATQYRTGAVVTTVTDVEDVEDVEPATVVEDVPADEPATVEDAEPIVTRWALADGREIELRDGRFIVWIDRGVLGLYPADDPAAMMRALRLPAGTTATVTGTTRPREPHR